VDAKKVSAKPKLASASAVSRPTCVQLADVCAPKISTARRL